MNTKSLTFAILSTMTLFCALHCAGQSNVVYYGANSNALDVVFVDTTLSSSAKSNIVADMNLCLKDWGKTAELRLWNANDKMNTAGQLDLGTHCPHYPQIGGGTPYDMDFPDDVVSNGTSGIALQVPKKLSDAYTNAFALAAANSNAIAAAYAFIAFVSSTNFPNIPASALPDYFLSKHKTADEVVEEAQEIISDLMGYYTYHPPSVLGFKYLPVGPGAPNVSYLWMRIPGRNPDGKWGSCLPAIWHEGKWKFSAWMLE